MVVVVSGPTDYVTDGTRTLAVEGGAPEVARVSGTGCALSSLVAAFAGSPSGSAAGLGTLGDVAACCAFYKACAAAAAAAPGGGGPGSFKVRLLDALAMPDAAVEAALVSSVIITAVSTPSAVLPS